ncbi:MAG: hypothetical protein OEY56_08005 [Cyclobacteriaceae bacterium]|nr:hypothetical protein [Cyclobacteriaceae bacterium]
MFTEYEIDSMIEIPEIAEATMVLKKEFIRAEAPYLELSDHDFFSLVMMAPTIGIALANGNLSLFEELALNKKARKLSKGGYFMKKDPVVYAMKFLIRKYEQWCGKFYQLLRLSVESSFHYEGIEKEKFDEDKPVSYEEYKRTVLRQPYILIRFIASFFLENDEDIISDHRNIGKSEYNVMLQIGEKVGIAEIPVFHMFCKTFVVKG